MSRKVAPFAGAWIEIFMALPGRVAVEVAPFAGAWIEIFRQHHRHFCPLSLPSRERGLKSCIDIK